MFKLIDNIPLTVLLPLAVIILLAPFDPMPHVMEKFIMLKNGTLHRPLDIFDLAFHLLPTLLLIVKYIRFRRRPAHPGD